MLLLHPAPTCGDADSDLCILHPDLCTLCFWWLSPQQLVLVVVFLLSTGADTVLALGQLALCGGVYTIIIIIMFMVLYVQQQTDMHCIQL